MNGRGLARAALALIATACASAGTATPVATPAAAPPRSPDVIFVPTPDAVVEAMMELGDVHPGDVVYDLGCGDGRLVIAAAKRGARRSVGVDIDSARIAEAHANARAAGVSGKVTLVQGDLFETDLSDATVVMLYLLPELNLRLRPRLLALPPGTRVVSHAFDMGDWKPDRVAHVEGKDVYLWTVPERQPSQARTGP